MLGIKEKMVLELSDWILDFWHYFRVKEIRVKKCGENIILKDYLYEIEDMRN